MLTSSLFVLWRARIEVEYLRENFVKLYIGGSSALTIPSYLRLGSILFKSGYMLILASLPKKSTFIRYSFLNLGLMLPQVAIGFRGTWSISIIFIIWYYVKVYNRKIDYKKILIGGFALVVLLQIVAFSREKRDVDGIRIINIFVLFFASQSMSFNVLPLYIQFKNSMIPHNYPFILDPILSMLIRADGQSLEVLGRRSSLGHQLVYTINPNYYLGGFSLGTSSIAELYEFGIIGIIVGSILFSWYVAKFNKLIMHNRWILFLSYVFTSHIISSPRAAFLPSAYEIIRLSFFAFVIFHFFDWIKKDTVNNIRLYR
jgi:oligosaccharide repeat unit polymerase